MAFAIRRPGPALVGFQPDEGCSWEPREGFEETAESALIGLGVGGVGSGEGLLLETMRGFGKGWKMWLAMVMVIFGMLASEKYSSEAVLGVLDSGDTFSSWPFLRGVFVPGHVVVRLVDTEDV